MSSAAEKLEAAFHPPPVDRFGGLRGLSMRLSAAPADEATLRGLLLGYAQLKNVYLLVRDELYRRADPEKFLAFFRKEEAYRARRAEEEGLEYRPRTAPNLESSAESKAKFKLLLSYFSSPGVVRALFQTRNPRMRARYNETRLRRLKEWSEEKYEEAVAKAKARMERGRLAGPEAADLLLAELADFPFFRDFMAAGRPLKAHVIRGLVREIQAAFEGAFTRHAATGIFTTPRPRPLNRISKFFVNLCENSIVRKPEKKRPRRSPPTR